MDRPCDGLQIGGVLIRPGTSHAQIPEPSLARLEVRLSQRGAGLAQFLGCGHPDDAERTSGCRDCAAGVESPVTSSSRSAAMIQLEPAQIPEHRGEELVQAGVGYPRLGFVTGRAEHVGRGSGVPSRGLTALRDAKTSSR